MRESAKDALLKKMGVEGMIGPGGSVYIPIGEFHYSSLKGKLLGLIEVLGLPAVQEQATKTMLSAILRNWWDDCIGSANSETSALPPMRLFEGRVMQDGEMPIEAELESA